MPLEPLLADEMSHRKNREWLVTHRTDLERKYPGKVLVIEGQQILAVLDRDQDTIALASNYAVIRGKVNDLYYVKS